MMVAELEQHPKSRRRRELAFQVSADGPLAAATGAWRAPRYWSTDVVG